ncbi:MAG TPA: TonB family protein, partial [Candidatus Eremiobacteraceae bacterium]|nr:TonB family protein [Candidatus Eremiobacteraceae bacterium]
PQDLQPPGDRRGHAVFGMTPDGATNGPAVDWKTLAPGVGYLRISSFPDSMQSVLRWAMSDVGRDRALVLDLRGNPGGLVDSVDAVAGVFLPVGTLISTGTRRYHFFGSQRFTATSDAGVTYGGRLVVLVDTNSRSGAESLARALQYYHRATLVGTQTAGKVLGVDVEMALDDGGLLRVATLDMHAPDGQRLEGHGVSPDLTVSAATRQVPAALALLDETTTTAPTAAPDAFGCPIGVKGLWRRAIGSVHGYMIYRLEIETTGRIDRARLLAQGAKGTEPSSILARGLTGKQTVYFTWPSDDVIGLEVVEVGGNGIAEMTGCLGAPGHSIEIDKDSLRFPETQTFDDSQVSLGPEIMTTQKVTDADFLTKVSPKYPELIREQGIQGFATVVVIVEKGGDLIDARIYRSSGNKVLDQSAIDAARASTYSEPRIGDTPIVEAYLAEYRWGLEPR